MIFIIAARLTRSSGTRRFPDHHLGTAIDPGSAVVLGYAVHSLIQAGANRRSEDLVSGVRRKAVSDSERIECLRQPAHTGTPTNATDMTTFTCVILSRYRAVQRSTAVCRSWWVLSFFWRNIRLQRRRERPLYVLKPSLDQIGP